METKTMYSSWHRVGCRNGDHYDEKSAVDTEVRHDLPYLPRWYAFVSSFVYHLV